MRTKFMCWDADVSSQEHASQVFAAHPQTAAEVMAETCQEEDGEQRARHISVRAPDGKVTRWVVTAEPDVRFMARREREET